jgi:hypothetical protein
VALGRKNFLHVGDEDAGANIAGLYSLVATCAANAKNPLAYLADVLGRIRRAPAPELETARDGASDCWRVSTAGRAREATSLLGRLRMRSPARLACIVSHASVRSPAI